MTTTDSTSHEPADDALLNDLEHDVKVAMDDLDLNLEQAISVVVGDSEFVPNREVVEVAFDLRERMSGRHAGQYGHSGRSDESEDSP